MKALFLSTAALMAAYAVSPYVSLYLMGRALTAGDVRALTSDVDWTQVRESLKQDIADGITGEPAAEPASQTSNDDLPPFGSGMVAGMAGNIVDRAVTPERLAQSVQALHIAGAQAGATIVAAHFTAPTCFVVALRTPQERPDEPPIELSLRLETHGWVAAWKVVRASVPTSLLTRIDGSAS